MFFQKDYTYRLKKTKTEKKKSFGDKCGSGTPGHISNPVVKAVSADGTWRATSRESRSLPKGFFLIVKKNEWGNRMGFAMMRTAPGGNTINIP